MNAYVCKFPGAYLGGIVVVTAPDPQKARRIAQEACAEAGRPHKLSDIAVISAKELKGSGVLYYDEGDY